jgi:hypothetical protein
VAGAQIRVRGVYLGTTDALGSATLRLPEEPNTPLPVALTCPDGFETPADERTLNVDGPGAADVRRASTLDLRCPVELRDAVVLVHAAGDASRLPVKVDGVLVGQTDTLGFAHIHVRAAPDSEFEVSLDTSANERLSPASPSRRYRLRRSDELFVLDTRFEQSKGFTRKRRADVKRRPPPKAPNDG